MSPKQHKAALELLQQPTVRDAAAAAQVSERTLYRWLQLADFQQLVTRYQDAAISDAIRRMSGGVSLAVETLLELIDSEETRASTRVNACRILLGEFRHLREFGELAERVSALETHLQTP